VKLWARVRCLVFFDSRCRCLYWWHCISLLSCWNFLQHFYAILHLSHLLTYTQQQQTRCSVLSELAFGIVYSESVQTAKVASCVHTRVDQALLFHPRRQPGASAGRSVNIMVTKWRSEIMGSGLTPLCRQAARWCCTSHDIFSQLIFICDYIRFHKSTSGQQPDNIDKMPSLQQLVLVTLTIWYLKTYLFRQS